MNFRSYSSLLGTLPSHSVLSLFSFPPPHHPVNAFLSISPLCCQSALYSVRQTQNVIMIIFQESAPSRGAKVSTNQQSTPPQTHQLNWQHTNTHIMPANELVPLISTYMPPFSTDAIKKKNNRKKCCLNSGCRPRQSHRWLTD